MKKLMCNIFSIVSIGVGFYGIGRYVCPFIMNVISSFNIVEIINNLLAFIK